MTGLPRDQATAGPLIATSLLDISPEMFYHCERRTVVIALSSPYAMSK